jgi:choline dehydrogenase
VVGLQNLRIADASVMPTITSGNTNSPTLMIAERAAAWMVEEGKAAG